MPTDTPSSFDLTDAVLWSEGMLLSPQHLQQNDIYWQKQMRARMASLDPDFWGLHGLEINERALADGVLIMKSLRAVLSDGLLVEYRQQVGQPDLLLPLKDCLPSDGSAQRIWIGVASRADDAARQDGVKQRYEQLPGTPVMDENTGGNPLSVARLRPSLSLLASKQMPSGYSACPLLEVARDIGGHYVLGSYHPPAPRLGASAFLDKVSLMRRLLEQARAVWEKVRELGGQRDDAEEEAFLSQESRQHLGVARLLAGALPHFDVVAGSPECHPRDAYHSLALLVGRVAAIGGNPLPPQLTPYNHDDCEPQFSLALDYVTRKLALVNTDLERLPFARLGDAGFARRLPDGAQADKLVIELKPRAGQGIKELQAWLANARIGSDDLMSTLRLRRMPGATIRALDRRDVETLGLSATAILFMVDNQSIELDGRSLAVLRAGRSLVIQGVADDALPAGILLYRWKREQPVLTAHEEEGIAVLDEVVSEGVGGLDFEPEFDPGYAPDVASGVASDADPHA
jgi:type VI secretion system protein ImpJ